MFKTLRYNSDDKDVFMILVTMRIISPKQPNKKGVCMVSSSQDFGAFPGRLLLQCLQLQVETAKTVPDKLTGLTN